MEDICQISQNCFPISDWSEWYSVSWKFALLLFILLVKRTSGALCRPRQVSSSFLKRKALVSILKPHSLIFIFNLCIFSSESNVNVSKAVLIFLPIVFSAARGSPAAGDLLKSGHFSFNPELRSLSPQENWKQLSSSSYKACKLALTAKGDSDNPTIPLITQRSQIMMPIVDSHHVEALFIQCRGSS